MARSDEELAKLDPVRRLLVERARERRMTLAELSRAAGHHQAYVHEFVWKGSPRRLPEEAREVIANLLELPADRLRSGGGPAPPPPRRPAPSLSEAEPRAAIPVFRDDAVIDPAQATEWTDCPRAGAPGQIVGLWITAPRGRLHAGDMALVHTTRPSRLGDTVVVVRDRRVVAIGALEAITPTDIKVCNGEEAEAFGLPEHQAWKVVVATFA